MYSVPLSIEATVFFDKCIPVYKNKTVSGINNCCELCSYVVKIYEKCKLLFAVTYFTDVVCKKLWITRFPYACQCITLLHCSLCYNL